MRVLVVGAYAGAHDSLLDVARESRRGRPSPQARIRAAWSASSMSL
jgi:hypothetical protein